MHKKYLEFLCDPITKQDLTLENPQFNGDEIISGTLRSSTSHYKISEGIPRFVNDDGYSDNFGYQWNRWSRIQFEDQNIGMPMENHTRNMFQIITELNPEKVQGKTILDVGCGPGRFTDVAAHMGASIVALDYSSAIDAAKENFIGKDVDICFIQGDALHLPLKANSIDDTFSIGVLHHTPSPPAGINEIHRSLKKGGEFAIRVYKKGFYTYPMVVFWRKVFALLRPIFGHYPPLIYSYFFGAVVFLLAKVFYPLTYAIRFFFPTAVLPDYRWTVLDTFDAITTSYQTGHEPEEIKNWLSEAGFREIKHLNENDFIAIK